MKTPLSICIMLAFAGAALAQTPPPSTDPSSASSPHQRSTTSSHTPEAPAPTSAEQTTPSSEHQRQVTEDTRTANAKSGKMMNDCIMKKQSDTPKLSKADAKRACAADMKKKEAH